MNDVQPPLSRSARFLALRRYRQPRQSMALVIVLCALSVLCILIVGFFGSIQTELAVSHSYQSNGAARLLAQTTLNLAISQIREATANSNNTWASQPGMIRSYDSAGDTTFYRLYSWTNMVETNTFTPAEDTGALAQWSSSPAYYTDLNEPVNQHGATVYPIIDYNAAVANMGTTNGFSVAGAPSATTTQPLPMPVQWLYVLREGQMIAPDAGSGTTATFSGTVAPTTSNPIVGRIAFWADDECSKVNINTASEGEFWDMPRVDDTTDLNLATFQPALREYQRYPGHPATTSLSAVFPNLTPDQIYDFAPSVANYSITNVIPPNGGVTNKVDRLYSSVDELLLTTNRVVNTGLTANALTGAKFFITAYNRAPEVNLLNRPRISMWPIDSTYASTFNTSNPNTNRATFYDQLLAFCSTMTNNGGGASEYFFQRKSPVSPTIDISIPRNQAIYSYLQTLTGQSIPGFSASGSASFLSKYPAGPGGVTERDQILTEIFDYIRSVNLADSNLTSPNQYAPPLTYITNMIYPSPTPSGGQLCGGGLVAPTSYNGTLGFGRFPTITGGFLWFIGIADSNSDPDGVAWASSAWGGATNAPPAGDVRVQAVFGLDFGTPAHGWSAAYAGVDVLSTGLNAFQWGANPVSTVSMGMADGDLMDYSVEDNGRPDGGRQGMATPLYNSAVNVPFNPHLNGQDTLHFSGATGYPTKITSLAYPWYSTTLDIPPGGTIYFKGSTVAFNIYYNKNFVQKVNMMIPSGSFPAPTAAASLSEGPVQGTTPSPATIVNWRYFNQRFATYNLAMFDPTDTVEHIRMAAATDNGDFRLIAGLTNVPATYFEPHPMYGTLGTGVANHFAHCLWSAGPYPFGGATYGRLVKNVVYDPSKQDPGSYSSFTPSGANNAYHTTSFYNNNPGNGVFISTAPNAPTSIPGDWDNGMAAQPDGPFINKVDEGDQYGLQLTPISTPYFGSESYQYTNFPTSYFSPNRQVPSSGMLGSLSTGVVRDLPWQTLMFRPSPIGHPGLGTSVAGGGDTGPPYSTLPDHLWMDLFWMPVVEPYAISEPFSTAGKVSMNYQIVPFTYIQRSTGVEAVLKNEQVMAIPNTDGWNYKNVSANNYRFTINVPQTLVGFQNRFNNNDIFRSASEISEIYLVPNTPDNPTYGTMSTWWNNYLLTGDNTRTKPYADIYPRLTTQSNTYLIHYRVQALQKVRTTAVNQWVEGVDQINSEYRGSSLVERYIDPNDSTLPDFVANPLATVNSYYRYRVVYNKQVGE